MKMEEMVEFLETQGFDAKKEYDRNMHLYVFTITKDGVTVTDNFKYPVTRNFSLKDKEQRDFLCNLMTVWENRKFYSRFKDNKGESNMATHKWQDPVTGKEYKYSWGYDIKEKGESNMKDNDNLMYALSQTTAGHLDLMGQPYPIMVKDVTVDGRIGEKSTTLLTLEVVGRYGDPNDKLYPKYTNNDMKAVAKVFDTLDMNQKRAVYELIGRALQGKAVYRSSGDLPKIEDVIFNPPATIVFWADNTKTVVKCQEGDDFDPEKGITMAYVKKSFDNKGNYYEEIKKWTKKYQPEPVELSLDYISAIKDIGESIRKGIEDALGAKRSVDLAKEPEKRWRIWWKRLNKDGRVIGSGVHHTDFIDESSARVAARQMFNVDPLVLWTVSPDNPWEKD